MKPDWKRLLWPLLIPAGIVWIAFWLWLHVLFIRWAAG